MKKVLILAALLGLASCTAELSPLKNSDVTLTVGVKSSVAATKAETVAGTSSENKVNNIQAFIFKVNNGTYVFEAAAKATATSVDITVTSGQKDVIVLVNEPADYTTIYDRTTLLEKVSSLSNNSRSSFVMFGESTCEVTSTSHTLSIPVERMAARVKIAKITNKLRNGLAGKNVKVSRVFLTNAGATATYASVLSGFYATNGVNSKLDLNGTLVSKSTEKSAVNSLTYKAVNSDVLAENASYSTAISLYAYPNDKTVKATCLVVEMEIDGRFFTYPVELPVMEKNHTLEVSELVISSVGNISDGNDILTEDEIKPVTFQEATFSVSVQPWVLVTVSNGDDGKYTI